MAGAASSGAPLLYPERRIKVPSDAAVQWRSHSPPSVSRPNETSLDMSTHPALEPRALGLPPNTAYLTAEPLEADFTTADGYRAAHDVWFANWPPPPNGDDLAAQLRRPNLPAVHRRRIVTKLATVPAIRVEISGETEKSRNEVEAEMAADGWPPPTPRFTAQQLSAPCQGQRTMTRARSSLGGSRRPAGRRTRSASASSSSSSGDPEQSDPPEYRHADLAPFPLVGSSARLLSDSLARIEGVRS